MSTILKQTFGYSLSFLFVRLQGLLLLPFVARCISREDYGLFETLMSYGTLVGLFAVLGLDSAMATLYRHPEFESRRREIAATCIGMVGVTVVLCAAVLFSSHPLMESGLFDGKSLSLEFGLLCCTMILSSVQGMAAMLLRQEFAVAKFNITSIGGALLSFTGTLIMVLVFKGGVKAMLAVQLIVAAFNTALTLKWASPYLQFTISRDLVTPLLRLGLPVLPAGLCYWLISGLDRSLLQAWRSGAEVGDYSMAAKIAAVATVLTTAFQTAWWPYAMNLAHKPGASPHFQQVCRLCSLAGAGLATGVGCAAPFMIWWLLPAEYHQSFRTVGLQVLIGVLNAFYYFPFVSLMAGMKVKLAALAYLGGMAATVALNFALIPLFGTPGAVWATILGLTVVVFLVGRMGEKVKSFGLPVPQALVFFLLTALANSVWIVFPAYSAMDAILRIAAIVPVVVAAAFSCGLVKSEDAVLVREFYQRFRLRRKAKAAH